MPTLAELKAQHRHKIDDPTTRPAPWHAITLSLPADTPTPVPVGRWERQGDRIVATYTRQELALAVVLALQHVRHDLEARLERGLDLLSAATGDDVEAHRLLAHWDALNAGYDHLMARIATLGATVPLASLDGLKPTMQVVGGPTTAPLGAVPTALRPRTGD